MESNCETTASALTRAQHKGLIALRVCSLSLINLEGSVLGDFLLAIFELFFFFFSEMI